MLSRFIMMFAVIFVVSACSTTDDTSTTENGIEFSSRDGITEGPIDSIYGEDLQGPEVGTQADLVVNVGDRVFFGYDRYDISDDGRLVLENQANWLLQYADLNIIVEGHTDERGTREYNIALGDRRANSVKNYLIALGVDPRRISTVSFGKERPAVAGSDESAWSQNRRSVTKVD